MGSELEEAVPEPETGRFELAGVTERGGGPVFGAKVSPSMPESVASRSLFMPEPHAEQNFAVSGTAVPHCEQYMGAGILSPSAQTGDFRVLMRRRLDEHGRAVSEHFRDAVHDFRRVVAKANHAVRTMRARVHQ